MLRNRFPRFSNKGGCNPHNLHVIPTASVTNLKVKEPNPAVIQITPSADSDNPNKSFFNQNKQIDVYKSEFNRGRKSKRQRKKGKSFPARQRFARDSTYLWCNPSVDALTSPSLLLLQKETVKIGNTSDAEKTASDSSEKNTCDAEKNISQTEKNMCDAPEKNTSDTLCEENYFEEVEVASIEAEAKQEVLVGFRKTKPCYLKYKRNGLFKPKFYNLADPTFVNCLNVHEDVDVDIVSEAEYEYETDNQDRSDSQEMLNKIVEVDDSEEDSNQVIENGIPVDDGSPSESTQRMYKTCVEGSEGFTQGRSLIQNSLNSWKSHLIGLEYLVEIQNATKDSVLKYYCVLCCEDLEMQDFTAVYVINHINSCKHVVRYLEKHFPAYGYKFADNSNYNIVELQKLSEEINQTLGYYFMCITSLDYYIENDQNIKEIIENAYHPNEKDLKLDKSSFKKKVESSLKEEIESIISDVIQKIMALEEDAKISEVEINKNIPLNIESDLQVSVSSSDSVEIVFDSDKKESLKDKLAFKSKKNESLKDKLAFKSKKNESKASKSCTVYKGNNALTSYMKLKSFATATFRKPAKRLSSVTKGACVENKNMEEKGLGEVHHEVIENKDHKVIKNVDQEVVNAADQEVVETVDQEVVETVEQEVVETVNQEEDSEAMVSNVIRSNTSHEVHKTRGKVLLRTSTVHSKYCRKRILGKESSRLRLAARTSEKAGFVSGVSKKSIVKCKSVTKSVSHDTPKKISGKSKEVLKHNRAVVSSSHKKRPVHKITSIQKTPVDSKSTVTGNSSSHHRVVHTKDSEKASTDKVSVIRNSPSVWRPITKTSKSPAKPSTSDSTHLLRSPCKKQSKSPDRRDVRRHSRSPMKRIKSPLRHVIKSSYISPVSGYSRSPPRRHSRSPLKRKSRSPVKRKSRSPVRRKSKSPSRRKSRSPVKRKSRSPVRRKSRSPIRKKSRSPVWKPSRSPLRRKSRSPLRRHSRSPLRQRARSPLRLSPLRLHIRGPLRLHTRSPLRLHARSPLRLHARSPLRHHSRSPMRRHSRSPLRHRSRSPLRRHSRSPLRHHSRSPIRKRSRSPLRRHSRSPRRHHSRSPVKRRSRSPVRRHSRSPLQKFSKTPDKYGHLHKVRSSNFGHSSGGSDHFNSEEGFSSSLYKYDKCLGSIRETSKMSSPSKRNTSDKFKSDPFPHTSARGISDLDPVSDEDESLYFNDKHQRVEDINVSSSSKMMLAKLLQKFSMADVNPNDPALNKLMQFMEAHSDEIQDLIGSQSKSGNINVAKVDSSVHERSLFLQQYLLSNLAGSSQEPRLPSPAPNLSSKFMRPPFLQGHPGHPGFGHPTNIPPPGISQPIQQRFFPPNVNVPPPQLYHQLNQPRQDFSAKPNIPPEVMFKDLKATVNKLFGANEGTMKQEKPPMPGYVTEPDPEKWDLNHPDAPKFNAPVGQKNVFHQGKNIEFSHIAQNPVIREEIHMYNNNNPPPGQFFGGRGINRPQTQNVPVPPPDAKVSFCDVSRGSSKGNLFPVVNARVNPNFSGSSSHGGVNDVKVSLAQRLASVLVKVGMIDVPAPLLQEMLMKIGAFSSSPRQDISEAEILSILKRLGYLS